MYRYIPLLDIITESILTEKLKPYKLVIKRKYVYGQYGSYMSVIKAKEKTKKEKLYPYPFTVTRYSAID